MIRIKSIFVLLFIFVFLFWVFRPNSGRSVNKSDFYPIPYPRLGRCERNLEGEIVCPDIRHKGSTSLRQAQLVLTRMLRIFDLIAKKHRIRYWLYKGTLLGAVRHQGHVPFDNDVDIAIPKQDFENFIKYGVKELPKDIFFQTEETDVNWQSPMDSGMFGKLRDTKSCLNSCLSRCKFHDGLMIDFFVLQNDNDGNFIEPFTSTSWFLRKLIYGPLVRNQSDIFPLTTVYFDGFVFSAPREWKRSLLSYYGDFMRIPTNTPLGHIITDPLRSCNQINWLKYQFGNGGNSTSVHFGISFILG